MDVKRVVRDGSGLAEEPIGPRQIISRPPTLELGGAPGGTRTHDLQVRNLTLYPLSYGRVARVAEREGFEPSKQVTPLNGLANRRTRPLCDLSVPETLADDSTGSRSDRAFPDAR